MKNGMMDAMRKTSYLASGNASYVENLFELYLKDPTKVPEQWRQYFAQLPSSGEPSHQDIRRYFLAKGQQSQAVHKNGYANSHGISDPTKTLDYNKKQVQVQQLVNEYRVRGHQKANFDPLKLRSLVDVPSLNLENFSSLSDADLDTQFRTDCVINGKKTATLKRIINVLESSYCHTVGVEFMHIADAEQRRWLQQRLETVESNKITDPEVQKLILERLTAAEGLEKYLGSRYPGTKRFGLEGEESLIPLLDELIQRSGRYGAVEAVIGMAHRGRLNVLVNTFGKSPAELFAEFEGKNSVDMGSGDVKYHQGFSSNVMTPGGEMHLALAFNPSHLEISSPVVVGSVRARQDRRQDKSGDKVVPISLHGDAAFAGQGVVMETYQMSQTRGFKTGGTIHVIINNQVGFTTSYAQDARSTEYCTDVAKMVQSPIFHVNADDPEAVLLVAGIAVDYRWEFKHDVVIDLVGYRRRGHNEADEPSATQPIMYKKIRNHPSVRTIYANYLVDQQVLTEQQVEAMVDHYRSDLEQGHFVARCLVQQPNESLFVDWGPYIGHTWRAKADTSFPIARFRALSAILDYLPEGFQAQRQVAKILEDRTKMCAGALPINWGYAELMAYATLLDQGVNIRLVGQDSGRGTFSHRHAILHCQSSGQAFCPLGHLASSLESLRRCDIYDSLLSEEAVLAFEYGYATTSPNTLVIWEAQFGDFANGAQVVIDQFIASGEHKWGRLCGLTMFLPHGYEGQGPEHSSARLERFLQLCAEHNIQVCIPTTPGQVYHMIRRQMLRPMRRPLVVMTPKSLLRHKLAVSSIEDLTEGHFHNVLPEIDEQIVAHPEAVKRLIFCSGKVYYDLYNKRQELERQDVAIIRVEQLYPFPEKECLQTIAPYTNLKQVVWCQEEPRNQGAWYNSQHHFKRVIKRHNPLLKLHYAGRVASAAPAVGYLSLHVEQQERLINQAINGSFDDE